MKTIAAKLFATILLWVLASSNLFAAEYRFSKVDVPNSTSTRFRGINARGDIVGIYADSSGTSHSFVKRAGDYSEVAFPGAYFTAVKSINARGDMAGNFRDGPDGPVHGFLFHEGAYSKIDYPAAVGTEARGINNAGDVTGVYLDALGRSFGFILKDGIYHQIHVPGSSLTDVYQVQDNGTVMVGDTVLNADGLQHGFLRLGPANFKSIDFPGTEATGGTVVRWINQRGDIVGAIGFGGYLLQNGKFTNINYPGAFATLPLAINDDGTIVGIFVNTNGVFHGFKAVPK